MVSQLARDVAAGLRRNLDMTVAVLVTVAISLSLLGTALLFRAQTEVMKDYWYDRIEISIFLCNAYDQDKNCQSGAVTKQQRAALQSVLDDHPQVEKYFFESQKDAYKRFRERFDSTIADTITADQLQASYRVKLHDPEEYAELVSDVAGLPGVQQVLDQRTVLERFFRLLRGFELAALSVAAAQVIAAVLLISNTVRMAVFSRRREITIMRLVGASNTAVRLPFILEAAVAGLVGAVLACGAIFALEQFLVQDVLVPSFRFTTFVGWAEVWSVVPIIVGTGVGIAAVASGISLHRHLKG